MSKRKTCTACGLPKTLVEFVKRYKAPGGRASICSACFSKKIKLACAVPKQHGKFEKPKPVNLEARRCTCTPRRHVELRRKVTWHDGERVIRFVRVVYDIHDALCMIFTHNQLDPYRKQQNTLEPVPQPFGTRRMWR